MTLLAGAAAVEITPPVGGLLDGYGGRTQGSQGVLDPLFVRVLVLDGGDNNACAIASCDLLGMHPRVTAAVRERVAGATGIPPEATLIAATHSHAGPANLRGGMFSTLNEALAGELIEKVTGAIIAAHASRRPATLTAGAARIETISMNRRDPDWPIDPVMRVVLMDGEDGQITTLLNFACHATIMTGANLMLSAEFPGAACSLVQQETGAPAVYLNGACGDVNPVWVRQDYENVQRVGRIVGGQALRTIGELRTVAPGQRAHNIRWDEFPEKPAPGRLVEPRIRAARRQVELPLRRFREDADYAAEIDSLQSQVERLAENSPERREERARLTRAQNERWAAVWARMQPPADSQRTEVQAIWLGDGLAVVALPGEFFVQTGDEIRSGSGIDDLLVACYANDYVGYVIPEDAYAQGGYEPGVTFCAEGAEAMIRDAAIDLVKELTNGD